MTEKDEKTKKVSPNVLVDIFLEQQIITLDRQLKEREKKKK